MKKIFCVFVLSMVSFIALPCAGTWNACGAQDIQDMVQDAITNCGPGSNFVIVDLCDDNHEYHVRVRAIQ